MRGVGGAPHMRRLGMAPVATRNAWGGAPIMGSSRCNRRRGIQPRLFPQPLHQIGEILVIVRWAAM
jgi:hypothetical protein